MNLYAASDEPTAVCDQCGARFREARSACPRCRAPRARQGSQQARVRGRSHETALAVGGLGLATLVVGLMAWPAARPHGPSARASGFDAEPSRAVASGAPTVEASKESVADQPPAGAPRFLDTKGAARIAYTEGRVDDALSHFREVLEQNPDDPEALNDVGQVLVRLGRASEAMPYLERAAGRFPDRWDFQFNLARALGEDGRWSEAAGRYRALAMQRPDDHVTAFNLARALDRAGQVADAVTGYERALELAPGEPSFHLALALARERAGNLPAARRAYEGYLALMPDGEEAERVRAYISALPDSTGEGAGGS